MTGRISLITKRGKGMVVCGLEWGLLLKAARGTDMIDIRLSGDETLWCVSSSCSYVGESRYRL